MEKVNHSVAIGNLITAFFFLIICLLCFTGFQKPKTYCIEIALPVIDRAYLESLPPMNEFKIETIKPDSKGDKLNLDSIVHIISKAKQSANSREAIVVPLQSVNYGEVIKVFNALIICNITVARYSYYYDTIFVFPKTEPLESNFMGYILINDSVRYADHVN